MVVEDDVGSPISLCGWLGAEYKLLSDFALLIMRRREEREREVRETVYSSVMTAPYF